jgi:hypothetical protein
MSTTTKNMKTNFLPTLTFLVVLAQGIVGTTTILYPIADSYLDSGNPNTNYGTSLNGYTFKDIYGTGSYLDLVNMFNISQIPSTIISAKVTYQQEYVSSDEIYGPYIAFNAFETSTNWTETTITWNNRATDLRQILTNYQDGDINNVIYPVTGVVSDAKTGGRATVAFRLHSDYSEVCVFMRENSIQYRPYMTVTY